jgi:hypothetical protein
VEVIALVGLAHGTSHFFHMLLPPLFPMLASDYGFSYAELGLLVTVFFVISGVGQAMAGFVVDRVGAWPVLMGAMAFFALAALAAAGAQDYWGFVLAAALAGVGNAPFHPADFSILNQRVSPVRLGHAFSVHGISGTLGDCRSGGLQWLLAVGHGGQRCVGGGRGRASMVAREGAADHGGVQSHGPGQGPGCRCGHQLGVGVTRGAVGPRGFDLRLPSPAIGVGVLFILLLEHLFTGGGAKLSRPGPESAV